MKSCGFQDDTRAREVDGVRAVDFFSTAMGVPGLHFKHLGTFEVGITSVEFVPARPVEENLLQYNRITNLLASDIKQRSYGVLKLQGVLAPELIVYLTPTLGRKTKDFLTVG